MLITIKHWQTLAILGATEAVDFKAALAALVRAGVNLSGANLRAADLAGAGLRGAMLSGARMAFCDLRGADLRNSDLSGADLQKADLRESLMQGCNLLDADLREANLVNTSLVGVKILETSLVRGQLGIRHDAFTGDVTAPADSNVLTLVATLPVIEIAQDAVGAMVDGSLTYVDATPLLQRAALTGDVTAPAGSNATTLVATLGVVEIAQDAVGAMVDGSLTYVDATPLLQRAALTGDVTAAAGSNATTLAATTGVVEIAQDAVGAMVDGSLTYVDATPLLQRAALTGDVTAPAGSNSTTIAALAVTAAKIAANTITLAKVERVGTQQVILSQGVGADAVWTGSPTVANLTTTTGLFVGEVGSKIFKLRWAATSVADGGTIAHGLQQTPAAIWLTPSVAGEMASATASDVTTFTVAIKKHDGTAGSTQVVSWMALV